MFYSWRRLRVEKLQLEMKWRRAYISWAQAFLNNYPKITLEKNTKREKKRADDTDICTLARTISYRRASSSTYVLAILYMSPIWWERYFLFPVRTLPATKTAIKGEGGDYCLYICLWQSRESWNVILGHQFNKKLEYFVPCYSQTLLLVDLK